MEKAPGCRNDGWSLPSRRKTRYEAIRAGIENVGKVAMMRHLAFTSCLADPAVWMRPAKRSDVSGYYEYILLFTDDALVVNENAEEVLRKELGRYFTLKEESIGPPKVYLGGHVRKVRLDNGVECWAFSSSQYVRDDVNWNLPRGQRHRSIHRTARNLTYHQSCSRVTLHTTCL